MRNREIRTVIVPDNCVIVAIPECFVKCMWDRAQGDLKVLSDNFSDAFFEVFRRQAQSTRRKPKGLFRKKPFSTRIHTNVHECTRIFIELYVRVRILASPDLTLRSPWGRAGRCKSRVRQLLRRFHSVIIPPVHQGGVHRDGECHLLPADHTLQGILWVYVAP